MTQDNFQEDRKFIIVDTILIKNMSINIFQFLKQGTTLSSSTMQKNRGLEQKITPKIRTPNQLYLKTGKFTQMGNNLEEVELENDWQELDEDKMKHEYNKKMQKSSELRKKYKIKVSGTDVPLLCHKFQFLTNKYSVDEKLLQGLAMFGVSRPTAVQMQTIPALLDDRNVLVTAPTGTGKTLAYLLPTLQNLIKKRKQPKTKSNKSSKSIVSSTSKLECIIITPQQQLCSQIYEQIEQLTSVINSDQCPSDDKISYKCINDLTQNQLSQISNNKSFGINVLITTPQTFLNLFASDQKRIKVLRQLKYVIMDQCDKYFQQSFLAQIRQLLEMLATIKPKPVYGLFSATIQHPVQELLKTELLDDALRIEVGGTNKTLKNVEQSIQYCTNEYGKILEIKNMIGENRFIPPALIFVQEKIRAKQLLFQLKKIMKNGPGGLDLSKKIEVFTGDKTKQERQQILQKFEKGVYLILITTDIMARGIDFTHVNLVINYDFPNTMLTYIHRVGRTGRAQRTGNAVTFFTEQDKPIVKSLANLLSASGCKVPEWLLQLPNVDRKLKKRLQKFPTKRLPVGVAEGRDKNFSKQLQKMQKVWKNKKERAVEKEKKQKGEQGEEEQESQWIQA